ncbi:hypothetical protein A1OQ_11560 [Enterovibrio norvegicus FF-162]|nr:hypothetical protein A1OQ_11560 [Enterovibrio norvegicus FF-162]
MRAKDTAQGAWHQAQEIVTYNILVVIRGIDVERISESGKRIEFSLVSIGAKNIIIPICLLWSLNDVWSLCMV